MEFHENVDALQPIVGQLMWAARRIAGSYLFLEFGSPHLYIREPVVASPEASTPVRQNLARRRVTPVGDWTLWIGHCQWEIRTANHRATSEDTDDSLIKAALQELDGQRLETVHTGEAPYSCALRFDLKGSMRIWPESGNNDIQASEDDQWSLYEFDGDIVSLKRNGRLVREPHEP